MIRTSYWSAIVSAGLAVAVTGCGQQSAAQTQAAVSKAEAAGIKTVADAREDAADKMADARKGLTSTQLDVAHEAAEAARSVAFAKAEAAHKVAIARCDGDSGDVRKACKDLADTERAAAKASAVATKVANDPKA